MPESLAIYGAANTSYSLAKELYSYVEKWATASSKAKAIKEDLFFTNAQAKIYVDFFKDHDSKLEPGLAESIKLATERLAKFLEEMNDKVKKYDPSKLYRRIQWPWILDDLEAGNSALSKWVEKLSDTFQTLPEELKDAICKYILNSDVWEKRYPVAALLEHLEMVKKQNELKKMDDAELLVKIRDSPLHDKPERDIYYWRDTIHVPVHIQNEERSLRGFKIELAKLVEVLKMARADITHLPQALCCFEISANKFGIAYNIPKTVEKIHKDEKDKKLENLTYTLKDLVKRKAEHTLDERLSLATQITRAVASIHELGWVHKALRSQNILLAYDRDKPQPFGGLGRVFLKGFTVARRSDPAARSTGSDTKHWQMQLYIHPKRQLANLKAEEDKFYPAEPEQQDGTSAAISPDDLQAQPKLEFYKHKHDIYSLGVILLELGLWQDLIVDGAGLQNMGSDARKEYLCELAKRSLGIAVGQSYLNIVTACLNVDESDWDARQVLEKLSELRL